MSGEVTAVTDAIVELGLIYRQRHAADFQFATIAPDAPDALARIRALKAQLDRLLLHENTVLRRMKQEAGD
jgi:DNA-binding MarR family transcriptional regulator